MKVVLVGIGSFGYGWYRLLKSRAPEIQMEDGALVTYCGSLAAKDCITPWSAEWRIEGMQGVLLVRNGALTLVQQGKTVLQRDFPAGNIRSCLDEFIQALTQGQEPETSGADYLHTQKLVHYARVSIQENKMVTIS